MGHKLRKAKLEYHVAPGDARKHERLGGEVDDPLSPMFVTLAERDGLGQARFWAAQEKRRKRNNASGVFDG